jgi:hypothetical protein
LDENAKRKEERHHEEAHPGFVSGRHEHLLEQRTLVEDEGVQSRFEDPKRHSHRQCDEHDGVTPRTVPTTGRIPPKAERRPSLVELLLGRDSHDPF